MGEVGPAEGELAAEVVGSRPGTESSESRVVIHKHSASNVHSCEPITLVRFVSVRRRFVTRPTESSAPD